jgi:hypothetical protein
MRTRRRQKSGWLAWLSLAVALPVCSAEEEHLVSRAADSPVVEDEPEPSGPVIDEGSEANAGVEHARTITGDKVQQMMIEGAVMSTLQQQAGADYESPSLSAGAWDKIEAVTGEPVVSSATESGVMHGATGHYQFRVEPAKGVLHIARLERRLSEVAATAIVSEAAIAARAADDLEALEVPLGPGMQPQVRVLTVARSDTPTVAEPAAYKVFIDLTIDGHPVRGRRLVLSYYLDGMLHKVSGRWLQVDAPAGPIPYPAAAQVRSKILAALWDHPLGAITGPLRARAQLHVVAGQLRHLVAVEGLLANGAGSGRTGEIEVPL